MNNRFLNWPHPAWQLGLLLAALWPHWRWMARRTVDGSDEPWGLLAAVTLVALVLVDRRRLAGQVGANALVPAGLLAIAAALGTTWLPPILNAALAVMAVVALLAGMLPRERPRAALAMLALLALPVAASLNFYLGYPLRWLCAQGSAALLALAGVHATPEGAALLWNGKTVLVDAPCAGIAMLWVGTYAAALLSYLLRAGALRTALNLFVAAALVVGGNTLRNTALFFKEAAIVHLPGWTHEAIGLLIFGALFVLLFKLCSWRPHAHR